MILVGSQRGGAKNLALHLMKSENEQVTVHEIRGFASDNLMGAFNEVYAVSRGTRCKQFLFSLSLNPPQEENVRTEVFEDAIARIEVKLGLSGRPRAIVFHEKDARRHCHAIWSRIDSEEMKAVPLPFTKLKLQELSRELYLENNWKMPRGLMASQERDPKNFSLAEWQQAKRVGKDAREIKTAFQDCWAVSDSKTAFVNALKERGFTLARGDRRGFVALDHNGEIYAVSKWAGVQTKEVRGKLGAENELPAVADVRKTIAQDMAPVIERLQQEQSEQIRIDEEAHSARIEAMGVQHAERRERLDGYMAQRLEAERGQRQARFNHGMQGLWDRLTGRHQKVTQQNEIDALKAFERDRSAKDNLIFNQLDQRRALQREHELDQQRLNSQSYELEQDASAYQQMGQSVEDMRAEFERVQADRDLNAENAPSLNGPDLDFEN